MSGDIPSITASAHTHSTYGLGNLSQPSWSIAGTNTVSDYAHTFGQLQGGMLAGNALQGLAGDQMWVEPLVAHAVMPQRRGKQAPKPQPPLPQEPATMARRLVQVFIADPNENVPLDQSLLYNGSQKLTDATDQELFFEIDIKSILDAYNKVRITIVDKKVKERTEYLEPVKIRDLKMVVVTAATF